MMARLGLLLLSLLIATAGAQAAVYRWVDKDGKVHYSDKPPSGEQGAAERVNIDTQPADPEKIAALEKQLAEESAAKEERQTEDAQQAQEELARRQQQCRMAVQNLAAVDNTNRMFTTTADGERRYYNDAEVAAAKRQAQARVDQYCN